MIPRRYVLRALLYSVCTLLAVTLTGYALAFTTDFIDGKSAVDSTLATIAMTSIVIGWLAFMMTFMSVGAPIMLRDPWIRANTVERWPIFRLVIWREALILNLDDEP